VIRGGADLLDGIGPNWIGGRGRNRVWRSARVPRNVGRDTQAALHMLIRLEVDLSGVAGRANPAGVDLGRGQIPAGASAR
jgi:hypothetical protein